MSNSKHYLQKYKYTYIKITFSNYKQLNEIA